MRTRLEQYKKTFPKYEMLGWYSTAETLQDGDLAIHQGLCEISDNLLYLTLDPVLALAGTARELPITIYEVEVHVVNEVPTMQVRASSPPPDATASRRRRALSPRHLVPDAACHPHLPPPTRTTLPPLSTLRPPPATRRPHGDGGLGALWHSLLWCRTRSTRSSRSASLSTTSHTSFPPATRAPLRYAAAPIEAAACPPPGPRARASGLGVASARKRAGSGP